MTISLEFVNDFVYEYCENVKTSKGGHHFNARCPLCGDSKKSKSKRRFNLDYNNSNPIFHCFNCGASGSFLTLYSQLKCISIKESLKQLGSFDPDYLIQKLSKRKRDKILDEIEHEYHDYILSDCILPNEKVDGYIKLQYQHKLQAFIKERNIKSSNVCIAYKGEYQGRYIIPIYDESGHIVYFQGRSSSDDIKPKYKNPNLSKGDIIYNKPNFQRDKYIVICEGLLDAMSVGSQGTSCLGKEITSYFLHNVMELTDKGIILALDNDKAGMESLIKMIKNNRFQFNIIFFLFPYKYKKYKDINEFDVNESINNMYKFILFNSFSSTNAYTKLKTEKWRKDIYC